MVADGLMLSCAVGTSAEGTGSLGTEIGAKGWGC